MEAPFKPACSRVWVESERGAAGYPAISMYEPPPAPSLKVTRQRTQDQKNNKILRMGTTSCNAYVWKQQKQQGRPDVGVGVLSSKV